MIVDSQCCIFIYSCMLPVMYICPQMCVLNYFLVLYLHACCIIFLLFFLHGEVSLVRLRPVWMTVHPPSVL